APSLKRESPPVLTWRFRREGSRDAGGGTRGDGMRRRGDGRGCADGRGPAVPGVQGAARAVGPCAGARDSGCRAGAAKAGEVSRVREDSRVVAGALLAAPPGRRRGDRRGAGSQGGGGWAPADR